MDAASAGQLLDDIASGLATAYPREALRGRLEQVTSVLQSAKTLISHLPDEEEREADLESRIMTVYKSGQWKGDAPDHRVTHTDHAANVLARALENHGSSS